MKLGDFFYLQRSDRQVILALLLVIAAGLCFVWFTGDHESQSTPATDSLATRPLKDSTSARAHIYYKVEERKVERFSFDPNTADSTQLLRLGLQPWQVRNIYKYRAAGGIYRRKEDFARLYGLTVKQYRELEPYIRISSDYAPASTLLKDRKQTADTLRRYPQKMAEGETIDLNSADTAALRKVPGIGSYYASRIVQLRQRLGGFTSLSQLDEIEDFPQQAKTFFTINVGKIQRININHLSLEQLRRHPYINYYQARAIIDYRRQHGPISDLSELQLLRDFPAEAIARLRPYVEY